MPCLALSGAGWAGFADLLHDRVEALDGRAQRCCLVAVCAAGEVGRGAATGKGRSRGRSDPVGQARHRGADRCELGVDGQHCRRRRRPHGVQTLRLRRGWCGLPGKEGGGAAAHDGLLGAEEGLLLLGRHAAEEERAVVRGQRSQSRLACPSDAKGDSLQKENCATFA